MDTSRIQEILIIWGNSCTKGNRGVSLQKIGCGSAIKVNFIALALHYLCKKEKLKTFRKDDCDYYPCFFIPIYWRVGNIFNAFTANYTC